jgi:hypothetical protein
MVSKYFRKMSGLAKRNDLPILFSGCPEQAMKTPHGEYKK